MGLGWFDGVGGVRVDVDDQMLEGQRVDFGEQLVKPIPPEARRELTAR